ncbi:MAG: hypothetical protein HY303_08775 [Candidatus Wallbacteria bacterium]|nr:hypothetical protein [Candidatus Wallbacteria bacterium]
MTHSKTTTLLLFLALLCPVAPAQVHWKPGLPPVPSSPNPKTPAPAETPAETEPEPAQKDAKSAPPAVTWQEMLKLKETKLFKVIEIFSKLTGVNVFVDDSVRDKPITLAVTDLPIDKVLDLILLTNSLQKKQVGPNAIVIFPPNKLDTYKEKLRTRVFPLQFKAPQEMIGLLKNAFPHASLVADDKTRTIVAFDEETVLSQIASLVPRLDLQELPVEREVFLLKHLEPPAAVPYLQGIYPGVKCFTDERLRTLTVYAPPAALAEMRSVLERLDHPPAQVAVEVKLLDVDRTKLKELGISLTQGVFTASELIRYTKKTLPLELSAILESGNSKVLAAPRLQLLNQKKASILIGDKIPLELKTAAQTAQGSINLATNVQYTNVGIQLDVEILQIHPTGEVTLSLVFDVSSVVNFTPSGFPRTSNRNANSVVRLKDGETIVLGGLLNESEQTSMSKIPLAGDLPLIGDLFRRKRTDVLTREIVMTVTPKLIVEDGFLTRKPGLIERTAGPPESPRPAVSPSPVRGRVRREGR